MNCPKCGAKVATDCSGIVIFECGTELDKDTKAIHEVKQCLRNQLVEARFEIAKLKAELELVDQEHKSELAAVTAERDAARAELKRREVEWDVLWSKVNTYFDPKGVTVVFQLVIDWMQEIRTQSVLRLSGEQPATAEKAKETL